MKNVSGFRCKTCEEISRVLLHAMHSDPQYQMGQRHSGCREMKTMMTRMNQKVLDHAKHCRKEKAFLMVRTGTGLHER